MSLFKKKSKQSKPENTNDNTNAIPEKQEDTKTSDKKYSMYMYLLMKEPCEMPQPELITQVFDKHIKNSHLDTYTDKFFELTANDYEFEETKEVNCPHLFVTKCNSSEDLVIDEITRSQFRNPSKEQLLDDCKYHVMAFDMFSDFLDDYKQRATLLMDYLEGLMELYPTCEAVLFEGSRKLMSRDDILNSEAEKEDRFVNYTVNVRAFKTSDKNDLLVDSLGMHVLGLPDLQYCFRDLDANDVMAHCCMYLSYLFANNVPIKNGDTVDSIKGDELFCQDSMWRCEYQMSIAQPERLVINVDTTKYVNLNN